MTQVISHYDRYPCPAQIKARLDFESVLRAGNIQGPRIEARLYAGLFELDRNKCEVIDIAKRAQSESESSQ